MAQDALEYRRVIGAPIGEAFRAFTRATPLRDWLCDVALADARPEGRLYLWWNRGYYTAGVFTAVETDQHVAFTWLGRDEPAPTHVEVWLQPLAGATEVRLVHRGLGEGEAWERVRGDFERGWERGLENLQSLLETGEDLRYTRRPMLGVILDDFNAEVAQELSVPVTEGIRIAGTVPNLGADKAGLQSNDVIVSMASVPAPDFPSLVSALQGRRAGDVVEVQIYRGAVLHTLSMELSSRVMPPIPPTAPLLAEARHQVIAPALARLVALVEATTPKRAAFKPGPKDWSILEIMAHMIIVEREEQTWIADLINDDERFADRYTNPSSVHARVESLVNVTGDAPKLLAALKAAAAETDALLTRLPAEFVAHRGSYWRLAHNLLQGEHHWQEHLYQIEQNLRAAG